MKISSAKQKGRRACGEVKELLLLAVPSLHPDDIEVTSSGAPGRDLKLSPAAQKHFPFAIEVKNVEKLNVREAYQQAISHKRPHEIPILFHTKNRDQMLVTLSAEEFLQLLVGSAYASSCDKGLAQSDVSGLQKAGQEKGP